VKPAEQVLESFQLPDESKRRHPPELVDQLERVPELLGRDSHLVDPVEREHRAGVRDGDVEPIRPTRKPSAKQRHARRVRWTRGAVNQGGQLFEDGSRLDLFQLPGHLLPAFPAVGLHLGPGA
jgi:hypothetical protein